ncbi:MFS transporter [Methylobacterium sp. J-092]|uniref:MFS transporter n=1 Tax=Methylobacterium sp. J-092 TaxID=2836667 RepID=UPI001FB8C133|nr:MFS transporter [Methylobacterium sp. J-092]MCJ2006640.1 MFS transporter [Methylobacterium sp. J-092]
MPARPRIRPDSRTFSALLGLLAALPTFGIDMILPSLSETAAAMHVPTAAMGAAMAVYLLGLGAALLVYGPVSDRLGRRPAIVCGCLLLIGGSIGCAASRTLPHFLLFRAVQGIGAAGPGMAVFAMVRDLFTGEAARARMSFVVLTVNVVPMVAPTLGASLMDVGGWRLIHAAPAAATLVTLAAIPQIDETLRRAPGPAPAGILGGYVGILANRAFLSHALCNAAAAGAVFAYITGSALVFIGALGFSPSAYGLVFGVSSLSVMSGAALNGRLAARGIGPRWVIGAGLAGATVVAAMLLVDALAWPPSGGAVIAAMEQEATVLFADIRDFTGLCETLSPGEVAAFLAEFRRRAARAIEAAGGLVDKFVGDEVMAVFGVPRAAPEDTDRAVVAARSLAATMLAWSCERARAGLPPVRIGVGLHRGPVFVGTIGAERVEFTAVGDTVNVARRLEQMTRTTACDCVASEAVVRSATSGEARIVAVQPVRGASVVLRLFAIALAP